MINYFYFNKFNNKYLLTNDFGKYIFLDKQELYEFLSCYDCTNKNVHDELKDKYFTYDSINDLYGERIRNDAIKAKEYIFDATQLNIFVVTNTCNMKCVYCQAQNGEKKTSGFMTKDIAKKAIDFALSSPSKELSFEFQGGEPLLNFEVIKYIVNYTQENKRNKKIYYSVVTNLTLMNNEIFDFLKDNNVNISTSLDGDEITHNLNRPFRNGNPTYKKVVENIKLIKSNGVQLGAIMTTTRMSFKRYKDIIDNYIKLGFHRISLRSLTPLGCANKNWNEIGYAANEFVDFYKKCFEYILQINKNGYLLSESIATIFLSKILNGVAINYMELRSPCGASIGQMAYYYDGNIYTCDEGRMLAEMGNNQFCLGNVLKCDYNSVIESKKCRSICSSSITESLPSCSDCVFQPYCGVCPIINYALYGDVFEKSPNNYRCTINKGILETIFSKIMTDDDDNINIFRSWLK